MGAWRESVGGTVDRAGVAAKTVGGTSRAAGEQAAVSDATNAIERATVAADPGRTLTGEAYEDLSKET